VEWGFASSVGSRGKNSDKDLWIRRGRFQLGTRRVISVPKSEDPDREVAQPLGGIGGSASSGIRADCSLSVDFRRKRKRKRQRTWSCTLCVTNNQHNAAKETRGTFSQPCYREGDARTLR
jgi:hypothetical protein